MGMHICLSNVGGDRDHSDFMVVFVSLDIANLVGFSGTSRLLHLFL